MANVISTPRDVRFGILEQSAWGTAEASSGAFEIIKCDPFSLNPDVKYIRDKHSTGARYEDVRDVIVHEKGAMPKFNMANIRARKDNLANFLYAFFQDVIEGATPFSKAFTFPTTGQVDFTNSGGHYMTAAQDNPGTTDDYKVHDCICEGLHFSCAAGDGNILTMTADMVSRGAGVWTEEMSGTWVLKDEDLFYLEDITAFTFNHGASVTPVVKSVQIDLTQKVFSVGQDSGNFQQYGLDEYGGKVTVSQYFEGATADLLGHFRSGTPGEHNITWGTVDTDGYLSFTFYGILESTSKEFDDGLLITSTLDLLASAASTKVPATVVLVDAQDKTWPAA